jgi:hypothetical protein
MEEILKQGRGININSVGLRDTVSWYNTTLETM